VKNLRLSHITAGFESVRRHTGAICLRGAARSRSPRVMGQMGTHFSESPAKMAGLEIYRSISMSVLGRDLLISTSGSRTRRRSSA
jgi:hypothetical protein